MKILNILLLLIFSASLFSEPIFRLEDEGGDDYGNGKVIYPENPMFDERIFDILSFEVIDEPEDYLFNLTVAGKISPVEHYEFQFSYDLPDDFILPLLHIYIDKDHIKDSGFTETIAGTNVLIDPENGWEKVVIIGSMPVRYEGELFRTQPELARNSIVPEKIKLSQDNQTLSVKISKRKLGEITEDWGFTVVMMSQDFSQTIRKNIYIREVNYTASQFNFGGGEGGIVRDFDPNVIDIIVPLGKEQKFLLNNYNREEKKLAVINAVYPYTSVLKGTAQKGEVKQVTDEKVVIDLGSENGIEVGSELIIDNKTVVIAVDVFPQLTIASFGNGSDWENVSVGMAVTILNK